MTTRTPLTTVGSLTLALITLTAVPAFAFCSTSAECSAPTPICSFGECVQCTGDADCGANQPYCKVVEGTCHECIIDAHCDWMSIGGACTNNGNCVECIEDQHCPPHFVCRGFGCDLAPSPILLDLDRNQFHLTGTDDPVAFDINADGATESISWTAPGSLDAFLCLDRNGNNQVDDGSELFGNHTPLQDGSTAENGYLALAEFDKAAYGGNGNGVIDPGDAVWQELGLWTDSNHDGLSSTDEFRSLDEAQILRLEYEYRTIGRTDAHGNFFPFVSRAWVRVGKDASRPIATTDVFLVME